MYECKDCHYYCNDRSTCEICMTALLHNGRKVMWHQRPMTPAEWIKKALTRLIRQSQ